MAHPQLLKRRDVPVEHTWDTASVFESDAHFEKTVEEVIAGLPELERYKGRLAADPDTLLACLKLQESLHAHCRRVGLYSHMIFSGDAGDERGLALKGRASTATGAFAAASAFIEPELIAIGTDVLAQWMSQNQSLAVYGHWFETLLSREKHVRSPEVEAILGQLSDPFASATGAHGILTNAEMKFAPVEVDGRREIFQGNIGALLTDPDRQVRRQAWERYADGYVGVKNTIASTVTTGVKQAVFMAKVRGYESTRDRQLSINHIPVEVFDNLITTFRQNLPTWHRYWNLRKRALGLDKLHPSDITAPLTKGKREITFEQATDWICDGMKPLGDEYVQVMRRGVLEERWVDRYPNLGKRSGAFAIGAPGTKPFLFLSFNNDIYGLSTLAHELGHAMHSYFTRRDQPQVYANYTLFAAEVASNLNQAMVRSHLLQVTDDRDFQISVIEEGMANFYRYFFVMPMLARFEFEIHERTWRGESLTAKSMSDLMLSLLREGYGDEVEADADRSGIMWAQFPNHIYNPFYVYQYATGISGAHSLCDGILSGRIPASQYLEFLSAGSSRYPLDALRRAGVDMATPAPVHETFAVLARLIDRLGGLLFPAPEARSAS